MFDQAQALRDIMKARHTPPSIRVMTVTSAKGGVGKTSTSINLAIALNKLGRRTLIVDMDLGLANVDVMLGAKTEGNLLSVIHGGRSIREIIGTGVSDVKFISGGSGVEEMLSLNPDSVQGIITQLMCLEDVADTVIFDTGAGISDHILRLIAASHDTLLVTTPEPTAFMDAYALVKILGQRNIYPNIRLVMNMADTEKEAVSALDGFTRIACQYAGVPVKGLGYILKDDNMSRAVKLQMPLLMSFPESKAAHQYRRLAMNLLNMPDTGEKSIAGFLKRLLGGG
ncbi:MAG TPA: MinD/ParA family protein [Feifaniaceae bacterium]|nr:MinD/ParA family protein [Feifaniaceae bacterium]